jgi:hypothetical protein
MSTDTLGATGAGNEGESMTTAKTKRASVLRATAALFLAATLAVPAVAGPPEGRGGGNGGGNGAAHGGPAEGQTGREFGMERAMAGGDNRSPRAWEAMAQGGAGEDPETDPDGEGDGEGEESAFDGGTILPDGTVEHELPTFISDLFTSD